MSLSFSHNTPKWIVEWVTWSVNILIPEWDVNVTVVDEINEEEPDNKGDVYAYSQYYRADVRYEASLEDTKDGQERVVHEICHAFLSKMTDAAENLISNKVVRKTSWKSYDLAEEAIVVKLSRVLVDLRKQCMLNLTAGDLTGDN